MSPKGNALANRPAEFFFCNIEREMLSMIETKNMTYEEVYEHIRSYIWYHRNLRVQRILNNESPFSKLGFFDIKKFFEEKLSV